MVDQERCKQHEQIEDGEHEQPVRSAAVGPSAPVQLTCEQKEKRPADSGGSAPNPPCKTPNPRELPGQTQEAAFNQDMAALCSGHRGNPPQPYRCQRRL